MNAGWKVRHEGSPKHIETTLEKIRHGLVEGTWATTDEVMGPNDTAWVAIENHPTLEELAAEVEPPAMKTYDDETHLDMNALIDVCLVLLVFFILTTTVAAMQKRLEAPSADASKPGRVVEVDKDKADKIMIKVSAKMEGKEAVIRIEDQVVSEANLFREMKRMVSRTGKTILLLEHEKRVPMKTVIQIIDNAKGAGMDKVSLVVD